MDMVNRVNTLVKTKLQDEPNTFFVNYSFPLDQVMFQNPATDGRWHPNCRGDRIVATNVLDSLFEHKILSRGIALADESECLANSACRSLSLPCCQRSALCYVNGDRICSEYGP